jgi:hypothetical protein
VQGHFQGTHLTAPHVWLAKILNSLLRLLSVPLGRLLAFRRSLLLFDLRSKKRHRDASIQAAALLQEQVSRRHSACIICHQASPTSRLKRRLLGQQNEATAPSCCCIVHTARCCSTLAAHIL